MDREKVKGVLWNLILNAKEAMPKGGSLIVTTKIVDDAFTEICVTDTGQGIAAGDTEQLSGQHLLGTNQPGAKLPSSRCASKARMPRHCADLVWH